MEIQLKHILFLVILVILLSTWGFDLRLQDGTVLIPVLIGRMITSVGAFLLLIVLIALTVMQLQKINWSKVVYKIDLKKKGDVYMESPESSAKQE